MIVPVDSEGPRGQRASVSSRYLPEQAASECARWFERLRPLPRGERRNKRSPHGRRVVVADGAAAAGQPPCRPDAQPSSLTRFVEVPHEEHVFADERGDDRVVITHVITKDTAEAINLGQWDLAFDPETNMGVFVSVNEAGEEHIVDLSDAFEKRLWANGGGEMFISESRSPQAVLCWRREGGVQAYTRSPERVIVAKFRWGWFSCPTHNTHTHGITTRREDASVVSVAIMLL